MKFLKKEYIEVTLDSFATIIEFKNTFSDLGYTEEEVIGENWFDLFIEGDDFVKIFEVFSGLFLLNNEKWETYGNDITFKSDIHKSIDFSNEIIKVNGEKLLRFRGVERNSSVSDLK